ncbi:MAG: redox-sensing transcriptional repressor Rex [Chitinivibrionales bacterium]|nr:redox-sensing transcriptional repressor Rex [Chitinivibrionales bacterium]
MKKNHGVIHRLSQYKNALIRLKQIDFVKVFSDNIADAAGETASQVRKDFSSFSITGSKKGGYQVDELIEQLTDILGQNDLHQVIIIGVGKIGRALMEYGEFKKGGLQIVAGFDIDPEKLDGDAEVPILPFHELTAFVKVHKIKIGIIAVPYLAARQAFDALVEAGIEGILNFAPVQLKSQDSVHVSNVNLQIELENLIYFVNQQRKKQKNRPVE